MMLSETDAFLAPQCMVHCRGGNLVTWCFNGRRVLVLALIPIACAAITAISRGEVHRW